MEINCLDVVYNGDICPNCNKDLRGEDIYQFFLNKYTNEWPYPYSRSLQEIKESIKQYPNLYNKEDLEFYDNELDKMTEQELQAWYTAQMYGWSTKEPKRFGNQIGIEIPGKYDGVSFWHHQECGAYWKRFPWVDIKWLEEDSNNDT